MLIQHYLIKDNYERYEHVLGSLSVCLKINFRLPFSLMPFLKRYSLGVFPKVDDSDRSVRIVFEADLKVISNYCKNFAKEMSSSTTAIHAC